jgi:tRNA threonylcarbamoyladenosine biosynthesis protein TsaB
MGQRQRARDKGGKVKILAVETSGTTFSAALSENGRVAASIFREPGPGRSETLIPDVFRLMKKAGWKPGQLDKLAVSTGPGSFTGIRVGLTFARVAAQDLDIPLVGVGTLEILKENLPGEDNVIPAIDALRNEVYVKKGAAGVEILPLDKFLKRLAKTGKKFHIIGSAVLSYGAEIKKALGRKAVLHGGRINHPDAGKIALAAEKLKGQGYETVKPLYIRRSWAEEKKK